MAKISIDLNSGTVQKESAVIGIDLGTTNSLIATIDSDTHEPYCITKNKDSIVPSTINFNNQEIIVGKEASKKLISDPKNTLYSVKRLMGKSYQEIMNQGNPVNYQIIDNKDKLVQVKINNQFYTPIELSSFILKELKSVGADQLNKEIQNFISLCIRNGESPAFRLNTISDIPWERYGIPQRYPQAYFLDYTKSAQRLHNLPSNYDMIFSYSQEPKYQKQGKRALLTDRPVAVVFRGFVPVGSYFLGREIVDGDLSDIKNQKQRGKIIGLKLKGNEAKKSKSLFIVAPSQASPAPFAIAAE